MKAETRSAPVKNAANALFWRDQTLAYLELRSFQGCEAIAYAKHAHEEFSIGAVTG